jgi:type III pantothenate kinase
LADLILDIGNTRTKAALFQGDRLLGLTALASDDASGLERFLGEREVEHVAIGSVAGDGSRLLERLSGRNARVMRLTSASPAPNPSAYATTATLGVDRWANALAASALFPNRAALAVDLGTCITYDLVAPDGTYLGGAITPGSRMRAKAMHAYSARLPLVEANHLAAAFGDSTETSLQAGLAHGVLGELEHFMASARALYPGAGVVLTGGDALPHARALKSGIFAHPFLTLEGLRIILHHGLGIEHAGIRSGTRPAG